MLNVPVVDVAVKLLLPDVVVKAVVLVLADVVVVVTASQLSCVCGVGSMALRSNIDNKSLRDRFWGLLLSALFSMSSLAVAGGVTWNGLGFFSAYLVPSVGVVSVVQ